MIMMVEVMVIVVLIMVVMVLMMVMVAMVAMVLMMVMPMILHVVQEHLTNPIKVPPIVNKCNLQCRHVFQL